MRTKCFDLTNLIVGSMKTYKICQSELAPDFKVLLYEKHAFELEKSWKPTIQDSQNSRICTLGCLLATCRNVTLPLSTNYHIISGYWLVLADDISSRVGLVFLASNLTSDWNTVYSNVKSFASTQFWLEVNETSIKPPQIASWSQPLRHHGSEWCLVTLSCGSVESCK